MLVLVRQGAAPDLSPGHYDDYAYSAYTLTPNVCHVGTFVQSPAGSATVGQAVTLTATATGCTSPEYQFYAYNATTKALVTLPFSATSHSASWDTTGSWYVLVLVRKGAAPDPRHFDDYAYSAYTLQ